MKSARLRLFALALAWMLAVPSPAAPAEPHGRARIFLLMVWDGLRPDLVTRRDTPNLFALAREGVRFDHHHSTYPTMTMVNGAVIATGAEPGRDGVLGNVMYLAPLLRTGNVGSEPAALEAVRGKLASLENSRVLAALNGPKGLNGSLVELGTIAQEVERAGGFTAVLGKPGPTFLFDDRVGAVGRASRVREGELLFASDDLTEPASMAGEVAQATASATGGRVAPSVPDAYFARMVVERALPAAKAAARRGKPALVVFWQRNPDLSQHLAGLGTQAALDALHACDANLGGIRAAVHSLGIDDATDLMVVSDHGFATIEMKVSLSDLLVGAGLKRSARSSDVVVAANGGTDLLYLSPSEFASGQSRRDVLQRIVNFASAQEWCGPVFSREPSFRPGQNYLGWIDGTFSQALVGLMNRERSPDLVISFRELADLDNRALTGPRNLAFALGPHGQQAVVNRSQALLRPVQGVVYADTTSGTTGMGAHGAAGRRELHNFCAALGPDFRRVYEGRLPTGNIDVAPTVAWLLGVQRAVAPPGFSPEGRVMREALLGAGAPGHARASNATAYLETGELRVKTSLHFVGVDGQTYLDDARVERTNLYTSP